MIRFQALGVHFSLPLLTLIAPLLAQKLGLEGGFAPLAFALFIHEAAHLAVAKCTGVAIQEIRILPFGGSARMENPYRLPLRQILPVAAAGPAANLLMAICLASLIYWNLLESVMARAWIQPNIVLFLFNLLPALPLDGGRILFALLCRPLGEKKALAAGLWSGRILACMLLSVTLVSGLRKGIWNLSFVLAALFILACGRDEKSAQAKSRAQQLSDLLSSDYNGRPTRLYQLETSAHVDKALSLLRPREPGCFLLTHKGKPIGMLGSREILNYIINGGAPEAALESLLKLGISPVQTSGAKYLSRSGSHRSASILPP